MNVKLYAIVGLLLTTQAILEPQDPGRQKITYDLANPTVEELTKIYMGALNTENTIQAVLYKEALTHHHATISNEAVGEKINNALKTLVKNSTTALEKENQALKERIKKLEKDKQQQTVKLKELSDQIATQARMINQNIKNRIQTIAAGA